MATIYKQAFMWKWLVLSFQLLVFAADAHQLVNLREHNPAFRFANEGEAFLVQEAAIQLSRVQRDLAKEGIALVILRAYLPESLSPSCCVDVNQDRISHTFSRGTAVDVTLEYISGNPLQLPCEPYSWFLEPKYRCGSCHLSCGAQHLERLMLRHGFNSSEKVWWHFDLKRWREYPPLNIPLDQLLYKKSGRLS
jgi:D-alanyl-D-alanine dipeptidase